MGFTSFTVTLTCVSPAGVQVHLWPQVSPTCVITADSSLLSGLFWSKTFLKAVGYVWMRSCIPRAVGHSEDCLSLFLPNPSQLSLPVHCAEVQSTSERLSTRLLDRKWDARPLSSRNWFPPLQFVSPSSRAGPDCRSREDGGVRSLLWDLCSNC